jgi:LysM repeat protein
MVADVLAAGARSVYLDLEPHSGFWSGTTADAVAFGTELRRLQPDGHVVLSLDPRPWMLPRLPMKEFAAFSNEIAPQQYWRTFDTPANWQRFNESGFVMGPGLMTPEFLLAVSLDQLAGYGLPISHVGQGAADNIDEWRRFLDLSYANGSRIASVWRYGVTLADVFTLLRDMPPPKPPAPQVFTYVVQPGDTLGAIAAANGTTVEDLMARNSLSDPNYLYVGQELVIGGTAPAAGGGGSSGISVVASAAASPPSGSGGGGRTYTVVSGDTLSGIAGQFGTSVDAIVKANALSDPDVLAVGDVLKIP